MADDHLIHTISATHPNCCGIKPKSWLCSPAGTPAWASVQAHLMLPLFPYFRTYQDLSWRDCTVAPLSWHLQLETETNPTPRHEIEDLQKEEISILKYHDVASFYHFITPFVNSKVPTRIRKRFGKICITLCGCRIWSSCAIIQTCHCSISSCFKKNFAMTSQICWLLLWLTSVCKFCHHSVHVCFIVSNVSHLFCIISS